MFLWTAAIALGLVALRSASPTWVAAMMGLALALLTLSALLVVFRRGQERAYWIGYATVGWLYVLLLVMNPVADLNNPVHRENLVTQRLSGSAYHWLYDKAFEEYYASTSNNSANRSTFSFYFGTTSDLGGDAPYDNATGMPMGGSNGGSPMPGMGPMSLAVPTGPPPGPNESDFVNVAHALWAMLLAAIGGCVASWLNQTGPGRTEKSGSVTT
jgi:hypothetical protein